MIQDKKTQKSLDNYLIENQLKFNDHFLMKIKRVLSFDFIEAMLLDHYALKRGRKAHNPVLMFKIVFLQYLYNLSTRQAEEFADTNIIAKCFLDLEMYDKAPDHTRIADFIHLIGERKMKIIFKKVIAVLSEKGIVSHEIGFIDSTHMIAAVDLHKVHQRLEDIEEDEENSEKCANEHGLNNQNIAHYSHDADARFGRKSETKKFYGYKAHTAVDLSSLIVTDYAVTSGEKYDGAYLPQLIDKSRFTAVTADKGYDDCGNHYLLRERGIRDFIALKDYRKNIDAMNDGIYTKMIRRRGCGERIFAITKRRYGMARCRYVGMTKTAVQVGMTYLVHNIAQGVRLLLGITERLKIPRFAAAAAIS